MHHLASPFTSRVFFPSEDSNQLARRGCTTNRVLSKRVFPLTLPVILSASSARTSANYHYFKAHSPVSHTSEQTSELPQHCAQADSRSARCLLSM